MSCVTHKGWTMYDGYQEMGSLEHDIHKQIQELRKYQDEIMHNKNNFFNWELSVNRLELMIDKLYRQQKVAQILEG